MSPSGFDDLVWELRHLRELVILVCGGQGDWREALVELEEAVRALQAHPGAEASPGVTSTARALGWMLAKLARSETDPTPERLTNLRRRFDSLARTVVGETLAMEGGRGAHGRPGSRRYELLYRVGRGATSEVYRARDRESGQDVAIKILDSSVEPGTAAEARLLAELRVLRRVRHAHITEVLDAGLMGQRPFVAMEYVPGRSVETMLRGRSSLLESIALKIAGDALAGLAAAHGARVVHRDVKPDNLRVTPDGTTKLVDFGLAKIVDDGSSSELAVLNGTPAYMAPEMVTGGEISPATDVYSMGCVLFRMLSGRAPFAAERVFDLAMHHVKTPAPALRSYNPSVPADLEAIVDRCLQKAPAARYPHAAAMADALADRRP